MNRDFRHHLSRVALMSIIKSHEEQGHVSLETLTSWNSKIKLPSKDGEFVCRKQYELIESSILKSHFDANTTKRLLYTVEILKAHRTGK